MPLTIPGALHIPHIHAELVYNCTLNLRRVARRMHRRKEECGETRKEKQHAHTKIYHSRSCQCDAGMFQLRAVGVFLIYFYHGVVCPTVCTTSQLAAVSGIAEAHDIRTLPSHLVAGVLDDAVQLR